MRRRDVRYTSILDVSKVMRHLTPCVGFLLPDLRRILWVPAITEPIYRFLGPFHFFALCSLIALHTTSFLVELASNGFSPQIIFHVIIVINSSCCLVRIGTTIRNHKVIEQCCHQIKLNLKQCFQNDFRQSMISSYTRIINIVIIMSATMQILYSMVLQVYSVWATGTETHPTVLQADAEAPNQWLHYFLLFYHWYLTTPWVLCMTSFEWLLLVLVRMTTLEMNALRRQLTAIFSCIKFDEESQQMIIARGIHPDTLQLLANVNESVEWMPVSKSVTCRENIEHLERCVKEWLLHYIDNRRLCRKMRNIFGSSVAFTYLYTVFMSTSLIISTKSEAETKFFLSFYAGTAMLTLFMQSYYGQALLTSMEGIANDALEKEWFNYPMNLKKSLVLILSMSQNPILLDAWGLAPLCMATFSETLNYSYTIFSFLNGFDF